MEANTKPKSVGIVLEAKTIDEIPTPIGQLGDTNDV